MLDDLLFLRVDHPVFPDSGISVFVQLQLHVFFAGRRREHFNNKIGRAEDAAVFIFIPVTDDQYIRLDDGFVIFIQLHVHRRDKGVAWSFIGQYEIQEFVVDETGNALMECCRRSHVIKDAVDQFYALVVRKRQIVFKGKETFLFCCIGRCRFPDSRRLRLRKSIVGKTGAQQLLQSTDGLPARCGCRTGEDFLYGGKRNTGFFRYVLIGVAEFPFAVFHFFYCHMRHLSVRLHHTRHINVLL